MSALSAGQTKQPLRVILASAGSGKTQRLAELVVSEVSGSSPPGVLAITFTRNAAGELRQRILQVAAQSNPHTLRRLLLGEIHLTTSTIDALVREWYTLLAPILGFSTHGNLIVQDEETIEVSYRITAQLLAQVKQPAFLQALRQQLRAEAAQKARRLAPDRFLRRYVLTFLRHGFLRNRLKAQLPHLRAKLAQLEPWQKALSSDPIEEKLLPHIEKALQVYRQTAQRLFLADLNDLVLLIAHHQPQLLEASELLYQRLFVDEAQDTSPQQWAILTPLIEELLSQQAHPSVTLIGDPKQSIYAWRGADYRKLLDFWQRAAHTETLDTNYRSQPRIVEFNNGLYARLHYFLSSEVNSKHEHQKQALEKLKELYNPDRFVQKAASSGSATPEVEVHRLKDETKADSERAEKLKEILQELRKKNIPPEETAFLVRANRDIERLMALLPEEPLQIREQPLGSCASLEATWRALAEADQPSPVTRHFLAVETGNLENFAQEISALREALTAANIDALQKWQAWAKLADSWQKTPRKTETVFWDFFLSRLYALLQEYPYYDAEALLRWWEEKGRYIPVEMPPQPGYYPVLTIHKAKGLAWQAVILPFVNWDLLEARWTGPRWTPIEPHQLPEDLQAAFTQALPPELPLSILGLPLQVNSQTSDRSLKNLYNQYFAQMVVENVNLHYVATTRPRQYLYLIVDPAPTSQKKRITWATFWAEDVECMQLSASQPD